MPAVRTNDLGEHEHDYRRSGRDRKGVNAFVNRSGSLSLLRVSAVGWPCVMPDGGKGPTPSMMAAFASAVHDRESATHQDYYRGEDQ
jgi:hypothetical protein